VYRNYYAATKDTSNEPFHTRFSVHRILELVKNEEINEEQTAWIKDAGFGALLTMSDVSVPSKLVHWIMMHIDPDMREFRLKKKVIVFDKQLVLKIVGVPSGPVPVALTCRPEDYEAFQRIREPFMVGVRAPISKCIEVLKAATDKATFMRAFVLLAFGSVLCATTDNAITSRLLHNLVDVSNIKTFDWAEHILQGLMDEVRKYQLFFRRSQGPPKAPLLGSCLIIFVVCFSSIFLLFHLYQFLCCIRHIYMFHIIYLCWPCFCYLILGCHLYLKNLDCIHGLS